MNFSHDDAEIVALMRQRSRRLVQSVFTCFALLFGALAIAAHHVPEAFSLPADEMPRIAMAFLFLSSGYTLMLFVWDWLFDVKA